MEEGDCDGCEVEMIRDMSETTASSLEKRLEHPHGNTLTIREMLEYLQGIVAADPSALQRHLHVSSGTAVHDVYAVEWSEQFGVVLSMM